MKKLALIVGLVALFIIYYTTNSIALALITALALTFIVEHYSFPIVELSSEASIHPNQRWNFLGSNFWKESSGISVDSPRVIYDADFLANRILESVNIEESEELKPVVEEIKKIVEERKKQGITSLFDFIYGVDASSTTPSQIAIVALKPVVRKEKLETLPINACLSPMPSFSLSHITSIFSIPNYDIFCSRVLEIGDVEYDTSEGRKITAYTYFVIPATPEPLPEEMNSVLKDASLMLTNTFNVLRELISTMWRMHIDMKVNEVNMESLRTLENEVANKSADLQEARRALSTSRVIDRKEFLEALQPEKKVFVSEIPSVLLFIALFALLGSFYGAMNYAQMNMPPANAAFTASLVGGVIGAVAYFIYTKVIKKE